MNEFLNRQVAVIQKDVYQYPGKADAFSPSELYPEYPFGEQAVSCRKNLVYGMVREGFAMLGFDKEHMGTPQWNPLGGFIKPGDFVLIKPNMVMHENHIASNGTECLITHPSVIRAVLDFVVIALGNSGHIVVGDAPLQSCDFEKLIKRHGFDKLISFYKKRGIDVELLDFRLITSHIKNGFVDIIDKREGTGCTPVDIGSVSVQKKGGYDRLRVTSYNPDEMRKHHNPKKHEYLVATPVLLADVIINLPKPKTHRKAGLTGALKNLIGINGNKDWLPHHRKGSKEEGGDEYLKRNVFKKAEADVLDAINRKINDRLFPKGLKALQKGMSILGSATASDPYREGSWYGNDTIWRTISDLNRILLYCDKDGVLRKEVQRKVLNIGDMIISGEGEGPLMPTPRKKGILVFGANSVAFDTVVAEIMGFDYKKIPSVFKNYKKGLYPLIDFSRNEIIIKSNREDSINPKGEKCFVPSSGWKGHIEKLPDEIQENMGG